MRDGVVPRRLCAQEDLLAAKKRRFAHFGLTNSASQRQDEAAVLRRLRYALIGDGASDGTRQLFNMKYDPRMVRDVAAEKPDKLKELSDKSDAAFPEHQSASSQIEVSDDVIEDLKALGYIDR